MEDVRATLAENLAEVDWQNLTPHAKRDALIVVTSYLDLVEVGVKVAANDTASVQNWISEQLIAKPSSEQLATWNQEPNKQFNTIIVQPFVLVQEVES